jgi:hypothetical protein
MRLRIGIAALAATFALGSVAWADEDDGDKRSKARARAEKHCAREAEDRGLFVEKVGDPEKVGKKQYEVKLRVDERYDDRRRKKDDFRVLCRYDDKRRHAEIF